MKSEINQGYDVQVREGAVTMDSYLFFPREFGDLLIEPGDEVLLVVRHNIGNSEKHGSWIGDSRFFEKVKNHVIGTEVMDRLKGKKVTDDPWNILKEAINKAREDE